MLGLFIILLSQIAYAFGGLIIRKYLASYNPVFVSSVLAMVSMCLFLPISFLFFRHDFSQLTIKHVIPFAAAGLLWLGAAEILYIVGLQKSPSLTSASLMTLFYPLFSAILGYFFLKDPLGAKTIIAAVLMLAGFVVMIV